MTAPAKSSIDGAVASKELHAQEYGGSTKSGDETVGLSHLNALTEDELAVEKKLRFKIDMMIMPLMIWTYLMNYIDR